MCADEMTSEEKISQSEACLKTPKKIEYLKEHAQSLITDRKFSCLDSATTVKYTFPDCLTFLNDNIGV